VGGTIIDQPLLASWPNSGLPRFLLPENRSFDTKKNKNTNEDIDD